MLEGFWPSSNWRVKYEDASIPTIVDVDPEDHVIPPYYDFRLMHPSLNTIAYMPFRDMFVCNFVLVQPTNPTIYHVWMGRAKSDVVKDQKNENYKKDSVQW